MKLKVKDKLFPIMIIGILLLSAVFLYVLIDKTEKDLNTYTLNEIQNSREAFDNLKNQEIKMLKLGIIDATANPEYIEPFLAGDRDKLYLLSKDTFETQKSELDVTNVLFHTTDGNVFLRVHDPKTFGPEDKVVVQKSKQSGSWGTGLELGPNGYALRVVGPYKNNKSEIIGYIEFGERSTPLLDVMKKETGNDYFMISRKDGIDPNKWATSRAIEGKVDNYNKYPDYVMLGATDEILADSISECFRNEYLNSGSGDGNIFTKVKSGPNTLVCGGFVFYDSADNLAGTIVVVKDITEAEINATKTKYLLILIAIIATIIIILAMTIVVNKVVIKPLKELTEAGNAIGSGDIDRPLPTITSKDEIKDLSDTMNTMVEAIRFYKRQQEEQQKQQQKGK